MKRKQLQKGKPENSRIRDLAIVDAVLYQKASWKLVSLRVRIAPVEEE